MKHPADDVLLAYIRKQQRSLWPVDIQEHIANCDQCSERCAEYELIGSRLESWAHVYNEDVLYMTVSKRVMQRLQEPRVTLSERTRRAVSQTHIALPVAAAFAVLALILLVGLGANIMVNAAKSQRSESTPLIVSPQPTTNPMPIATFGAIPTVGVSPTAGEPIVTVTPEGEPTLVVGALCTTTHHHMSQDEMHVCGAHFAPRTKVEISYHIGSDTKKHTVQVADDGTFIDDIYVRDCDHVPSTIHAHDTNEPSERAEVTQGITFGTC